MTYCVSIEINKEKVWVEPLWVGVTAWLEVVVGNYGEDWTNDVDGDVLFYAFKHERDARHFDAVWNKRPMILPYEVWREFCLSSLARGRMDCYWKRQEWKPLKVLFSPPASSAVKGGRRKYWPSHKCWFFERDTDALLFYMEHA